MAKATQSDAGATPNSAGHAEFPLSLEEFCARLSVADKRVEMIGAFAHTETRAGRTKGLASEYEARFDAFVNKPA
jgi:hypothetical protein